MGDAIVLEQLPEIRLCGVRLHRISESDCVRCVVDSLQAGQGGWLHTVNLDILRLLVQDIGFAETCASTDLVVADGMPLVWASRLARTPLPERVAGSDLISSLSSAVGQVGGSIFLLGGNEGTAEETGRILVANNPGLRLVGCYCPELGFEKDAAVMAEIGERLSKAQPDIVFVALSVPKTENFIQRMRPLLPKTWWVGVGISFSFLTGDVSRAPRWMQKVGLEWLHRLLMEPRRLARRYLVEDVPFVFRLLTGAFWRGLFNKHRQLDQRGT